MIPFSFSSVTRSRVVCAHGSTLGGLVVQTTTSAATICIANSSTSKGLSGLGGSSNAIGILYVKPSQSPWSPSLPEGGLRMDQGIYAFVPSVAGVTVSIFWR